MMSGMVLINQCSHQGANRLKLLYKQTDGLKSFKLLTRVDNFSNPLSYGGRI